MVELRRIMMVSTWCEISVSRIVVLGREQGWKEIVQLQRQENDVDSNDFYAAAVYQLESITSLKKD